MAYREIPEGSIEIQTCLYAHQHTYTVGGNVRTRYNLYSAEGYCFYSLNVPENFGNIQDVVHCDTAFPDSKHTVSIIPYHCMKISAKKQAENLS